SEQVYWSPRWKDMLGFDEASIGSSPDEWIKRVHEDDRLRVTAALHSHLQSGSGYFDAEHRVLHCDGTYRWVLCRGAAVRNSEGRATRLAGSFTDITDAKVS